ncbi:hypothetical protein [Intrasporangium calvum]|uniref:hypothetical protein n=1 Tax=Intrasporangium calvum TaxID=53358 RepID=UPI002FF1C790
MAETNRATPKSSSRSPEPAEGFTAEERAAMKEHAKEIKAARRRSGTAGQGDDLADVLGKIAESRTPGSSRRVMPRSASTTRPASTRARCGRRRSPSPS